MTKSITSLAAAVIIVQRSLEVRWPSGNPKQSSRSANP